MITLQFTGIMAEKFGVEYVLDVKTPREALLALCSMKRGLKEYIRHNSFNMWVDDRNIGTDDIVCNYGDCVVRVGLHVEGAGGDNGGLIMIIVGVVIIAFTWWTGAGAAAGAQLVAYGVGAGLVAAGAAQLLMPKANIDTADEDGNRASYGFGNAVTTVSQGNNVPVLYGKGLIGGFVIMYRITTEEI